VSHSRRSRREWAAAAYSPISIAGPVSRAASAARGVPDGAVAPEPGLSLPAALTEQPGLKLEPKVGIILAEQTRNPDK